MFVRELHASYGDVASRVQLKLSLADLALPTADALPLGLICNELVSNAFKHAFPDNRRGNISIALRYAAERHPDRLQFCELQVVDDGMGLPPGTDVTAAESMGFHIIQMMTQQLEGTLEVRSRGGGTSFLVAFPLAEQ